MDVTAGGHCHRTSISGNNSDSLYVNSWEKKKEDTLGLEKSPQPWNGKGQGTIRIREQFQSYVMHEKCLKL